MVVQHNLRAMNSNRMLGLTARVQSKSAEKLASGYKINRAADDAAGLSISEKMRKQIRGLTQASLNAADGISAVQTAEGALNEVQDMLQRMNELAVKAANGTMSTDDRQYIQDEIDQLVTEIDRVAETTKFNETYLLKGDTSSTEVVGKVTYQMPETKFAVVQGATAFALNGTNAVSTNADISNYIEFDDETGKLKYKGDAVLYSASASTNQAGSQLAGNIIKEADLGNYFKLDMDALWSTTATNDPKTMITAENIGDYFDDEGNLRTDKKIYAATGGQTTAVEVGADYLKKVGVTVNKSVINGALELSFQVGAETDSANKISVTMEAMSAAGLGVDKLYGDGVTGKDSTNADAAVDVIADAIQKISTQRSALGAVQNRLEHTIANLDNVVENTTAAESQIRDTDMATEMVKFSNNSILAQAGQAMLAQANQANQGVLSLLG